MGSGLERCKQRIVDYVSYQDVQRMHYSCYMHVYIIASTSYIILSYSVKGVEVSGCTNSKIGSKL